MPTPPPWCSDTQVAPLAVFSSALSNGQSETASEPSSIASVSRFGLATEPRVQMVAADHDRRLELPARDHLVEREPEPVALAEADPADARRQPLKLDPLARHVEPAVQVRIVRESAPDLRIGARMSSGSPDSATQRNGPDAAAEQRPDVGRDEARECRRHP